MKKGFNASGLGGGGERSVDPCQPAQSTQADTGRKFSLCQPIVQP